MSMLIIKRKNKEEKKAVCLWEYWTFIDQTAQYYRPSSSTRPWRSEAWASLTVLDAKSKSSDL
jgi:hypothetical protein